ncbi:unnamed protein product [Pieris brassicae]|uniref:Uncharacterized protein n=1 Tax=Pieris brassicae TaxID=7116 RepID=A0A9P0TYZ9_PIEBR|nr:unnamed protein product [Pieris brassicae]
MPDEMPDWGFWLDVDYDHTAPPFNIKRSVKELHQFLKVLRQMNEFWLNLRLHGPFMFRFMCPYCGLPFSTHARKSPRRQTRRQG